MSASHARTLIVGGGIGGLSAALAIARAGRDVTLLEQATDFVEIGAGLQVGPNAVRVMDQLGLLEELLAVSVLPRRAVMLEATTAEPLTELDFGPSFRERYGYPYVVVHRSDLLSLLVEACRREPRVRLETDRTVVEAWTGDDGAGVRCADGEIRTADVVVGADGLRSHLRTLVSDDRPVPSGFVAFRGTLPFADVTADVAPDDVVLWVGPGLHLIQYPVRRGEIYNQVAVVRSERLTRSESSYDASAELDGRFETTCAAVRGHVAAIPRERYWSLSDRDPLLNWTRGRLTLLGDAAHPMLQYLGQGACQALEDSVTLARELARRDGADDDKALAAYEEQRLPRTVRCQRTARPWGEFWHTDDPMALTLRRRILRGRHPADYTELDWLYADPDLSA